MKKKKYLIVCCLTLFLASVLIWQIQSASMRNGMSQWVELVKFLRLGGRLKCAVYDFEPAEFSFLSTNTIYRLRFNPRRAVPHEIVVSYVSETNFNWKAVRQALDSFSAHLTIRHENAKNEMWMSLRGQEIGFVYKWEDGRSVCVIKHKLFEFSVGNFEWRYDDEIDLTLEVCTSAKGKCLLALPSPRLTVQEGWIVY